MIRKLDLRKRIALVAHDNKKSELVEWAKYNKATLNKHQLYATGTTGTLLEEALDTHITKLLSGPLGGDQQIGALIAEGNIDVLIFFWDPMSAQPHDPDIKALLRLGVAWNIPIASDRSTADFILTSPLFHQKYEVIIPIIANTSRDGRFRKNELLKVILQKKRDLRLRLSLILFVISIVCRANPDGPQDKYEVLHNFEYEWITYNQDLKVFIPYYSEDEVDKKSISLKINLSDYPNAFILVKSEKNKTFLFFDNILKRELNANQWNVFAVNDLKRQLKESEIVLSLYGTIESEGNIVLAGYPINNVSSLQKEENKESTLFNLTPRTSSPFQSGLVVMIFFFNIVMMSFLSSNYSKAYKKYFNLYDLTSPAPKENSFLINKPMDRPNVFFLIFLSLLGGFLIILLYSNDLFSLKDSFFFQNGITFGIILTNFFRISLLIFVGFVCKYFYILMTGKLFNIEKVVDIHFFKIIQSSIYFFALFVLFILILQNTFLAKSMEFKYLISFLFTVFYGARTFLIYLTINQKGNIKTLYLISYLCIVEVFPIIIGLRIFL